MKITGFIRCVLISSFCLAQGTRTVAQPKPPASRDISYSHEWGKIISLDGEWDIAEGSKQQVPALFLSKIPVPGLVTSAKPGFKAVGEENTLREA
ncbi:MAG TPA: hypothetical protein VEX65_01975, partial [Flavisolibacter sp.]|nr:hypothetical protein [Flavisolibacter sp.]